MIDGEWLMLTASVQRRGWGTCQWWALAIGLAALLVMVLYGNWFLTRPMRTHQRFMEHLTARRFDAACDMIDPGDRGKIPAEFWERCEEQAPFSLIAPHEALFSGRMAMEVIIESAGEQTQLSCVVEGDHIRLR